MMFLLGDKVLISSQIAESLNVSRIVTVAIVDYYDSFYPYLVEFSNGLRQWVAEKSLRPIEKNRARVV